MDLCFSSILNAIAPSLTKEEWKYLLFIQEDDMVLERTATTVI